MSFIIIKNNKNENKVTGNVGWDNFIRRNVVVWYKRYKAKIDLTEVMRQRPISSDMRLERMKSVLLISDKN